MNDSTSLLTVPSLLHSFFSLTDVNTDIKLKKLSKNGNEMKGCISRATLIEDRARRISAYPRRNSASASYSRRKFPPRGDAEAMTTGGWRHKEKRPTKVTIYNRPRYTPDEPGGGDARERRRGRGRKGSRRRRRRNSDSNDAQSGRLNAETAIY